MGRDVILIDGWEPILLILGLAAAVTLACFFFFRMRYARQIRKLDAMLDAAIDGSFTESRFDESQQSYLENKLWKYLSSSEMSARKTAEEKAKIKTLIADISHQTKTPAANIRLYAELLAESGLHAEQQEYAEQIAAQSEKLSFLIASLVKLSRLETGIIALSPKKQSLAPMLQDVIAQAQPRAEEKGLSLSLACGEETAVFDEKWTAEAIWNIVDNAVKYTEHGSIRVSVQQFELFVCIEIADTGCGIAESDQAQIFTRFYRAQKTAAEDGLGIGLYLARQIVAAENGYIKVTSEVGKGSVFYVFLSKV